MPSSAQSLPHAASRPSAIERLAQLDWPGNVRELRNTVERLLILASAREITADDVDRLVGRAIPSNGALPASSSSAQTFEEFKERAERAYILAKLREHDWNVSETARAIDMPRSNLYKKIERYNLVREEPLIDIDAAGRPYRAASHPSASGEHGLARAGGCNGRKFRNFIGGEWVDPSTGEYFENRNPADTSDLIGQFPRSGRRGRRARRSLAPRTDSRCWRRTPAPRARRRAAPGRRHHDRRGRTRSPTS